MITIRTFRKLFYLSCVFIFSLTVCFAQLEQSDRLEIPLESNKFDISVFPVGEKGVISVKELYDFNEKGEQLWQVSKLDTLFNAGWNNKAYVNAAYIFSHYFHNDNYFYLLFTKPEYGPSAFILLQLNLYNGELVRVEDKLVVNLSFFDFRVLGNSILFGGSIRDNPVVVLYDIIAKKHKVLPAIYQKNAQLVGLEIEPDQDAYTVTLVHKLSGNKSTLSVKTYTLDGELLSNIVLKPTDGKNLTSGKMTQMKNGDRFILGTYSGYGASSYSRGMYIAKLVGGDQEFINFYNYADFKNFFSYMRPKRKERVETRINKRKSLGKEIRLSYRMLMHDIIPLNDRFIVVGEAYYPVYRQDNMSYGFVGANRIFEGWKYTHAIVCGFDDKGKLLWDNTFEILDVQSPGLHELVKVYVGENVYLMYNSNNTLKTKVVNGYNVLEEKNSEKIKTYYQNDIIAKEDKVGSSGYWYNGYFIAWGIQDIRNTKDKAASINRKVFYLNKVKVK